MRRTALAIAAIAAIAALTLAACGKDVPTATTLFGLGPAAGDTVHGTGGGWELLTMREKWSDARAGRDYSFVTSFACFCPQEVTTPVRVTVHGAQVTSVRELVTGKERPAAGYYTIEGLFDRAMAERARDGVVRVTYSRAWGYPVALTVGTPENDAGVSYGVSDVRLQ